MVVVRVGLAIGHHHAMPGDAAVPGLEAAQQQFVAQRVVIRRPRPRQAVFRLVRRAQPQAVGLHAVVGGALLPWAGWIDAGQQPAGRGARLDVGIDLVQKLMVRRVPGLHAVQRLVVRGVGLASDGVADAGQSHQIALVRGVDEHGAAERAAGLHHDPFDVVAAHLYAARRVPWTLEHSRVRAVGGGRWLR